MRDLAPTVLQELLLAYVKKLAPFVSRRERLLQTDARDRRDTQLVVSLKAFKRRHVGFALYDLDAKAVVIVLGGPHPEDHIAVSNDFSDELRLLDTTHRFKDSAKLLGLTE